MITSNVFAIDMSNTASVDVIVEGLPTPSPPKHLEKPDYAAIKETHHLLTENRAGGDHNNRGTEWLPWPHYPTGPI